MKLMPGGYIGVDVFFVISGFLVTSVLCSYKKFTYEAAINFYGKRIKRLFPSSYVCLRFYYFYHPTLIKHSQQETELFYDIISIKLSILQYYIKLFSKRKMLNIKKLLVFIARRAVLYNISASFFQF